VQFWLALGKATADAGELQMRSIGPIAPQAINASLATAGANDVRFAVSVVERSVGECAIAMPVPAKTGYHLSHYWHIALLVILMSSGPYSTHQLDSQQR
jgi:hypothetical protein